MATFNDFSAKLAMLGEQASIPLVDLPDLSYVDSPWPAFVAPDLSDRGDVENPFEPQVAVVSAAGAVGKSTIARELAYQRRALLWDLASSRPVAQGSASGLLLNSMGDQGYLEWKKRRDAGSELLIVDALDEGRLRTTEDGFMAFLQDIAAIAGIGHGCGIVLLGRTQISETVWLKLQDLSVRVGFYEVQPFSKVQAVEYIEKRIRHMGETYSRPMDHHPAAFVAARDALFERLREAIQGDSVDSMSVESAHFLGYAPVLDAISVLLGRERNLEALKNEFQSLAPKGSGGARGWGRYPALLRSVLERIADREQTDKLGKNIRPALQDLARKYKWDEWSTLYSPEEQWERLASRVLKEEAPAPPVMPAEMADAYIKALDGWFGDHPFLKDGREFGNTVFESYVYCRALSSGRRPSTRGSVEARLRDLRQKPSRLLSGFYLLFHEEAQRETIPPTHIGILYDSMVAGETDRTYVRLTIDGEEPEEADDSGPWEAEGEFEIVTSGVGSRQAEDGSHDTTRLEVRSDGLPFKTTFGRDDEISFSRYLRDVEITAPCAVRIGGGGPDFEIGPAVSIRVRKLILDAEALIVGGRTKPRANEEQDESVVLEAQRCQTIVRSMPVMHVPLYVGWPEANRFPWASCQPPADEKKTWSSAMDDAYRRFRRIVMTLRSHGRGSLARTYKKVEHQRVLQGEVGAALLAALLRDRVLELKDHFYHWNPERAGTLVGISWQQLRQGKTTQTLSAYLKSFVERKR